MSLLVCTTPNAVMLAYTGTPDMHNSSRIFSPVSAALAILALGSSIGSATWAAWDIDLSTVAEQSGFRETGRYAEVEELCRAFAARYPKQVRCSDMGISPEGRTMWAMAASNDGTLTPEQARKHNRPVIVVQGGIHAGEIDGKDAGFRFLRELLQDKERGAALDAVTLVFVPVFNVDGHERFGRWNRPNQAGPEEMGWRTTAQNLNLNRDARAWHNRSTSAYRPVRVMADCSATVERSNSPAARVALPRDEPRAKTASAAENGENFRDE